MRFGALILDIAGESLTQEDQDLLRHPMVGGVIFFSRNYRSRSQLSALCLQIRNIASKPILILVDQEGGRVQRFREEFTLLPAMGTIGKMYDEHPDHALSFAHQIGNKMASELLSVGIDLSLAPVLDVNDNQNVIGDRAFHANPDVISSLASALIAGMRVAGMAAMGKHFPGHGTVSIDSHISQPIDTRTLAEIEARDLIPFRALIQQGLCAIMPSHILFPHVDSQPVIFSSFWLRNILRKKYGFQGAIISDDLNMQAAKIYPSPVDRVLAAKEAGCDLILLCNNRADLIKVLDNVDIKKMCVEETKWQPLVGNLKEWQGETEFRKNNTTSKLSL